MDSGLAAARRSGMTAFSRVAPRPDLGAQPYLGYTASRMDRAAALRSDVAAISKLFADRRAGFYLIGGELVVMKKSGEALDALFSAGEAQAFPWVTETVFLGLMDGAPRFGIGLDPAPLEPLKTRGDLKLSDLRTIAIHNLVATEHLPPLAEAKAVLGWHARHHFCPNCGSPSKPVQAGWRRDCPVCKVEHFPRTDPVAIMLPIDGERCVLGRSPRFAPTMFSCLAGFAEPGETIEEAVRREVLEEVGIACGRVTYFTSQPWPFPMSLMIGCYAQALNEKLVVDHGELEDARWFEREELALMLLRKHPDGLTATLPHAIAHHIIRRYIEEGADVLR
jgi:NAD+ diphosphatase